MTIFKKCKFIKINLEAPPVNKLSLVFIVFYSILLPYIVVEGLFNEYRYLYVRITQIISS